MMNNTIFIDLSQQVSSKMSLDIMQINNDVIEDEPERGEECHSCYWLTFVPRPYSCPAVNIFLMMLCNITLTQTTHYKETAIVSPSIYILKKDKDCWRTFQGFERNICLLGVAFFNVERDNCFFKDLLSVYRPVSNTHYRYHLPPLLINDEWISLELSNFI